jgi:hypothetical protein
VGAGRARRVVVVAVALVAVAGAVLAGREDTGIRPTPADDVVDPTPDLEATARSVSLTSPMDGTSSRLLPVVAEPSTGLRNGETITIAGSGFTPGATLGAVLCSSGAAGGGGVAFCELAHYDNFRASAEGAFVDDYVLRRFIITPSEGPVDCASSTDRCILGVGNVADYDESGGSFISFAGAPQPPPPSLQVTPTTGLVDGSVLRVQGTGVRAAPDAWLRQCPAGEVDSAVCRRLDAQLVGPQVGGHLSVSVAVSRVLGSGADAVDCAAAPGCVLATTEYAGRLATVPLQFLGPPDTTTTSTSTTSTSAPPTTTSTSTTSTTTEDAGS